jgi:hypothetical protein
MIIPIVKDYSELIEKGALLVVEEDMSRLRILPL